MTNISAPREVTTAYRLGKIVYVPHYSRPTEFVGPGYHEKDNKVSYSERQLLIAGATPEALLLWPRPKFV